MKKIEYDNLGSSQKDEMSFMTQIEIVELLKEIKKLLVELVGKKGK